MKHAQLTELLTPIVTELGLECLGVEYSPSTGSGLVRVYIDAAPRAVNVDDCEAVSRKISTFLDVHDPIQGQYTLEVSSPGLERPLFTPEQFGRYVGHKAKLTLNLPRDGRRRFQGVVRSVTDATVTIEQDGELIELVHDNIQKANLVAEYRTAAKKKPGRK